jgi:hypothetical protein
MWFNYKGIVQHVSATECGHLQGGINKNKITRVSEPFHHRKQSYNHSVESQLKADYKNKFEM